MTFLQTLNYLIKTLFKQCKILSGSASTLFVSERPPMLYLLDERKLLVKHERT